MVLTIIHTIEVQYSNVLCNYVDLTVFFSLCFPDRDHFQLGSLSHLLNAKAGGYQVLPDWPEAAPDPSVRNVEVKESVRAVETVTARDRGPLGAPQNPRGARGALL